MNQPPQKRGLKQKEAAKLLGVYQPKISALNCGRLSGFSVERLFKFLAILNQYIEITIKPHRKNRKPFHSKPNIHARYVEC